MMPSVILLALLAAAVFAVALPGVVAMERETDDGDWTLVGFRDCDGCFSWRISFSRRCPDGTRMRWSAFRLRFEDGSVSVLSCPVGAIALCLYDGEASA
jgi:hypothetical protein